MPRGRLLLRVASTVAFGVTVIPMALDANASSGLRDPRHGVVSTAAIGQVPFGASPAQVRAWAGTPDLTSPPFKNGTYPVPRMGKGAIVWVYECAGIRRSSSCHTLFGFWRDKLTTFLTDSPQFAFPNGVRPGLTPTEAERRTPQRATIPGYPDCSGFSLPTAKGSSLEAFVARWTEPRVFSLYASQGHPAFDPHPNYC